MELDCRGSENECLYEPNCLRCYFVRLYDIIRLTLQRDGVQKDIPEEAIQ